MTTRMGISYVWQNRPDMGHPIWDHSQNKHWAPCVNRNGGAQVSPPLRDLGVITDVHPSQTEGHGFLTLSSMPRTLHRTYGSNDLHFLTFSCYHRRPFFCDADLCNLFLEALVRVRRRYRFVVLAYVVMPEHVHLLVSEPQRETLSTVVQALKLSFVRSAGISRGVCAPRSRNIGETWGTPICDDSQNKTCDDTKNKRPGVPHFSPKLREVGSKNRFCRHGFTISMFGRKRNG